MKNYVTGDIHGGCDIEKLYGKDFPEGKTLNKEDVVIVAGDFGLIWSNPISSSERYWLKWLDERPWTTMFVDGNHENHVMLGQLPVEEKFGGKVGVVNDSVFYLKRGEIYEINNKKILAFGGAQSTDIECKVWVGTDFYGNDKYKIFKRTEGKDWWREEIPSEDDKQNAWNNLEKHDYKVDFIIAHTLPKSIVEKYDKFYGDTGRKDDPTSLFLDELCSKVEFERYFCGHFHDNEEIGKYTMLFDSVIEV